jgi:hypothetical protein
MPYRPQVHWEEIDEERWWLLDWHDQFCRSLPQGPFEPKWRVAGQMRGFHIVFHLRIQANGELAIRTDDDCIIRRDGQVIYSESDSHELHRHVIDVRAGDLLEIAQWNRDGEWRWGARWNVPAPGLELSDIVGRYRDTILQRLDRPEGPPLKMFVNGASATRAAIALYSFILNGYVPSEVVLFGEHQWNREARAFFAEAFPFARVVPTDEVYARIKALGGQELVDLARSYWWVMKACIMLLCPPEESCYMDDDIIVLDRMDDALEAFRGHDLVFSPDADWSGTYLDAWGSVIGAPPVIRSGSLCAGFCWLRNTHDPGQVARYMLAGPHPKDVANWVWEPGLIAVLFAGDPVFQLPTQRYFYPLWDGMPGGYLEYDYAQNPCGFATIHFGGWWLKPSDQVMLQLAPDILGRMCPEPASLSNV